MNAFLPILVNPQTAPHAIGRGETASEPVVQVGKDQSTSLTQTFSPVFAQVLDDLTLDPVLAENNQSPLDLLGRSESNHNVLIESHVYAIQALTPLDGAVRPASGSGPLADSSTHVSAKVVDQYVEATNESIPGQTQKKIFEQALLPEAVPTIVLTPSQGPLHPANGGLPSQLLQPASGGAIPGLVRTPLEIEGSYPGNLHVTVPKVLEAGPVSPQVSLQNVPEVGVAPQHVSLPKIAEVGVAPQHVPLPKKAEVGVLSQYVPQGPEGKLDSSVLKQEERQGTPRIAPSAKDVPSGLQHISRLIQEDEPLKLPIVPRPSISSVGSHNLRPNYVPPVTAIQQEGPAGFSQVSPTSVLPIKPIPGISSVVSDGSRSPLEHGTTVPTDLLGESGLFAKGEHGQNMGETSIKSTGVDVSSGQGLGSGMQQFHNPQSGFQPPSANLGQGMGVRGLEERVAEFPAPALQRLQMDVQLSETQRVSIDVGVQNRQVYAGLVMDHAVLRNLANQFVPQLESQLADVDMELQEFSAEVREEREEKDDALFNDSRLYKPGGSAQISQGDVSLPRDVQGQRQEHGLYLVA